MSSEDDDNIVTLLEDKQENLNDINYETSNDLETELSQFRMQWKQELTGQQKRDATQAIKSNTSESKVTIISSTNSNELTNEMKNDLNDDEFIDTSNEKKAEYLFNKGVMLEQRGQFNEAVKYYRMAMQFDEDIEFKVCMKKQHVQHHQDERNHRQQQQLQLENDLQVIDLNDKSELTLYEQFQSYILAENHGLCEMNNAQRATHLSDIPVEVVMLILRWVVSDDLDVRSLENISCVCKGLYVCARDPDLWKSVCDRIWKRSIGNLSIYNSWRDMYLYRPRLNFDGLYISKCSYIRAGEYSLDGFYKAFHLVDYYRYCRFFSNGSVIMLTSPDEPKIGVSKLKSNDDIRDPYILKGHWSLDSNNISILLTKKSIKYGLNKRKKELVLHQEQLYHILTTREIIGTSLLAGAAAGAIAKTCIAPLDRAKINFQVSHAPFAYNKLFKFIGDSIKSNGVLSLWRGNSANMVRVVPSAAINFTSHEQWKKLLKVDAENQSTPIKRIMAGSLAGMTACAATYPADLARARMAVTNKIQYSNLIQIFVKTYKYEGLIGLYRGFIPTLLGSIPYAGVGYFTYETLKRFHKSLRQDDPHHIQRVIYGALAGAAGQTASYPLDVIRRRMQTAALVNKEEMNLNAIDLIKKIIREEGLRKGLYKGLSMNWIKGPIAAGIGFATNDYLKASVRSCYVKLFNVNSQINET